MKIHFVGIGGIGISGLAFWAHSQGAQISGSDIAISRAVKNLKNLGIKINIPHDKNVINNQSMLIHSAIIRPDNVELVRANELGIPVLSRSEALKMILAKLRVFSVCGAHGKSSTTAMLSAILNDCSAIIGAESKEFNSNVRAHKSDTIIFEADESDGSFLNSNPYCAIVTNAEPEHMEYYNYDLNAFHRAYEEFLERAQIRVINAQDPFLASINLPSTRLNPARDIREVRAYLRDGEPFSAFSLFQNEVKIGDFEVWGFGAHTLLNASLAILAALNEMDASKIAQNLKNYKGIKKRFDVIYNDKCVMIDDYGHHPTEIKSTLDSIKQYASLLKISRISAIWQPHKYSRTIHNLDGFIKCFKGVDKLVILPVWRACEEPIDIDFAAHFKRYNPLFATKLLREDSRIHILADDKIIDTLDSGLIVGFGAGDISYQMRGAI